MFPHNFRLTPVLLLLLLLCTGMEYAALTVCRPKVHGLEGVYYDNATWQGKPFVTAVETDISTTTLKAQRNKLPHNQFSVVWTGYLEIPKTGMYTFFTNSDDGSWLAIDDKPVVDNGGAHGLREAQGEMQLAKGLHRLTIRYFQIGGDFVLNVSWANGQGPKTPLTEDVLFPPNISTTRFQIYHAAKRGLPLLIGAWGLGVIMTAKKKTMYLLPPILISFYLFYPLLSGITQVGRTQVGRTQVGRTQVGRTQVGITQVGRTQVGRTQVGRTQVGRTQVGRTQVGRTQVGRTQVGTFAFIRIL